MYKKNVWAVALFAAFAAAVMVGGCVDPAEDEGGVEVDVVKLSEVIKNAPVGVLATPAQWNAVFKDSPFAKCGDGATFEIINEGGVNKLKIWKMTETWGQGIDIRSISTSDNVGAGFKAGDEIQVKGTASPAGIILNSKGEAFAKIANWASGETFDEKFVLTADDAGNIKGNGKGIRLQYDSDKGKNRKGDIVFEEIYVKGKRGAGDSTAGADYSIPGGGSYTVDEVPKADAGKYYYVDLNAAVKGQSTGDKNLPDFSDVKIDATGININFTKKEQYVFVPFDEDLLKVLVDGMNKYYTFDIVIDGTGTAVVEWCFDEDGAANWGITGEVPAAARGPFNTKLTSTQSLKSGRSADRLGGFLIKSSASGSNYTAAKIVIKSIKITPKAATIPITASGKKLAIALKKPTAGSKADTSVKVTGKNSADAVIEGATGAVKWIPDLPSDGNWAASTAYTAIVTVTQNPGYIIPVYGASDFDTSAVYDVVSYNPATKEVAVTFKP